MFNPISFSPFNQININFKGQANNTCRPGKMPLANDTFEKTQSTPAPKLKRGEIACNKARKKSWIFRDDISWNNLGKYLQKRYNGATK